MSKRVIIWAAVSSDVQAADEKDSLDEQLRRQRERAARNGWLIIDEILIEGFSRRFYTYREFAEAAAAAGHSSALRMFAHWEERDFDILSCRELSRLGREQSILSEVISRTIDTGAVIVPLDEAPIDVSNYRMHSAISGVGASEHIDKLKRYRDFGMKRRAGDGLTVGRRIPLFYTADENGKLHPDRERFQRLFDDMAELFLDGTSYEQFPRKLADRGHFHPETGMVFNKSVFQRLIVTARTWGHAEFNRTGRKRGSYMQRVELWVCGRGDPPPNVYFKPNVFEPIWIGAQGEDMKDELERRYYAIHGAARPHNTYPFSGLCICEECGRTMSVQRKQNPNALHEYVVCHNGRLHQGCHNNRSVRFDRIREYLDLYIQRLLQYPAAELPTDTPLPINKLAALEKDITRITTRRDALIDLISEAPLSARAAYQKKIEALTAQIDILNIERANLASAQREHDYMLRSRLTALNSIRDINIWSQPNTMQNQLLRKILGRARVICRDGEVVGLRAVS